MAKGFFNLPAEPAASQSGTHGRRSGQVRGQGARQSTFLCGKTCTLRTGSHTPRMPMYGQGKRGLFILSEFPSATDDEKGRPLMGESGAVLRSMLGKHGIDLERDCLTTHSVRCCVKGTSATPKEMRTCLPFWLEELRANPPKVALIFGSTGISAWLDGRWMRDLGGISRWRGWGIPDHGRGCWAVPTYHPSFLLRYAHLNRDNHTDPARLQVEADLALAVSLLDKPLPAKQDERWLALTEPKEILAQLRGIEDGMLMAFDYETTGIKPHKEGHRIVSCGIALSGEQGFAFPMDDARVRKTLARILANPSIRKVAANIGFEESWSRGQLGTPVQGWEWDTMLTSHTLDNRPGINSLKFQAAIRWGIFDYDSEVSRFLESGDEDGGNSMNRIDQAPLSVLLKYNAMDAILEFRLYQEQLREIGVL